MPDKIQRARAYVHGIFQDLASSGPQYETILIRDGQYCGHRFACGDFHAIWFCEEDEVKVYDEQRQLLQVLQLGETRHRQAA